jgi:hypothetical protein
MHGGEREGRPGRALPPNYINVAARGDPETTAAEVIRQLGIRDEAGIELVREATDDAPCRRRPRW